MSNAIHIRPGQAEDLNVACDWLQAAGLPTADLTAAHMRAFQFAEQAQQPVGMVGLEAFADCGLLRSLVVAPHARANGVGARLVAAFERQAKAAGLLEVWLLTIDAERFFAAHNYDVVSRDQAPAAIQQSAEFASLCPDDAVLMRKVLPPGARSSSSGRP